MIAPSNFRTGRAGQSPLKRTAIKFNWIERLVQRHIYDRTFCRRDAIKMRLARPAHPVAPDVHMDERAVGMAGPVDAQSAGELAVIRLFIDLIDDAGEHLLEA